jgi:hypothetical protein
LKYFYKKEVDQRTKKKKKKRKKRLKKKNKTNFSEGRLFLHSLLGERTKTKIPRIYI